MARKILQERIEEMELGEDARTKIKQREMNKKKKSAEKKKRRKYRKLAEGEEEVEEDEAEAVDAATERETVVSEEMVEKARKPDNG